MISDNEEKEGCEVIVSELYRPKNKGIFAVDTFDCDSYCFYHHPNSSFTLLQPFENPRRENIDSLHDDSFVPSGHVIKPVCINPVTRKPINYGVQYSSQSSVSVNNHVKHHTFEMIHSRRKKREKKGKSNRTGKKSKSRVQRRGKNEIKKKQRVIDSHIKSKKKQKSVMFRSMPVMTRSRSSFLESICEDKELNEEVEDEKKEDNHSILSKKSIVPPPPPSFYNDQLPPETNCNVENVSQFREGDIIFQVKPQRSKGVTFSTKNIFPNCICGKPYRYLFRILPVPVNFQLGMKLFTTKYRPGENADENEEKGYVQCYPRDYNLEFRSYDMENKSKQYSFQVKTTSYKKGKSNFVLELFSLSSSQNGPQKEREDDEDGRKKFFFRSEPFRVMARKQKEEEKFWRKFCDDRDLASDDGKFLKDVRRIGKKRKRNQKEESDDDDDDEEEEDDDDDEQLFSDEVKFDNGAEKKRKLE